ncbi:65-kDa microtubule-associated protein 9-like [Phragmites australis]|uniref:65-kDa microtubule-associated protein 9-like n=1 Tax=Phragmites australis TaxID=29695 RepID=UPI002D79878D|nr:65-kDa microtubule-associated protein 9-like [Phragmites australis]
MDVGEVSVHGVEQAGDISDGAIARLASEIESPREIKRNRMQKLQDLAASMLELWNLMDTPSEEQRRFQSVACNVATSEDEITKPNALSMGFIDVEAEVARLENLKECRMKDLVVKKYEELKEIRRRARLPEEEDGDRR